MTQQNDERAIKSFTSNLTPKIRLHPLSGGLYTKSNKKDEDAASEVGHSGSSLLSPSSATLTSHHTQHNTEDCVCLLFWLLKTTGDKKKLLFCQQRDQ